MKQISLIVPTYNEAKNLPLFVEEIFEVVDTDAFDIEIIVVDDNSPDGTGDVARELAATYPLRLVARSGKLGLGSAVRAGFAESTRPIMGVMDADLSHDPVILNEMLHALDSYDVVLGSRFEDGSTVEDWKMWRKLLSQCGVALTQLLSGVKDPLSGYFFLRREVIEGVPLTTTGYKILFEILVKGNHRSHKEFPYNFRIRKYSDSKLSAREYVLFAQQILSYTWYKLVRRR